MNINNLFAQLDAASHDHNARADGIKADIGKALAMAWDDSGAIQRDLTNAESASLYQGESDGIYSWFRASSLDSIDEREREFFDDYACDHGITRVDWENSCLLIYQGDDSYIIQTEHSRDSGVYLGHKKIFDAEDMKVDGDFSEEKIAWLIERHMEANGYFPGVFELSYHGNVEYFETCKRAASYTPIVESDSEEHKI
jgi:hypothetical protein